MTSLSNAPSASVSPVDSVDPGSIRTGDLPGLQGFVPIHGLAVARRREDSVPVARGGSAERVDADDNSRPRYTMAMLAQFKNV